MRTIVDLPKEQLKLLSVICESRKISRAEVIRKAISAYLRKEIDNSDTDVFGLWKNRSVDSVKYQNRCRDEWGI